MKIIKKLLQRFNGKQINVVLRKSGHMTDAEMQKALSYSRDCSLMRALEEIRARLEDELSENAFHGTESERLKTISRIEGMNEYYKNIMVCREFSEEMNRHT